MQQAGAEWEKNTPTEKTQTITKTEGKKCTGRQN